MRAIFSLAAAAVLAAGLANPALAQPAPGVETRLVVGVGIQGGVFGDDAPRGTSRVGVMIGLQVRRHPERGKGLVLDVGFQPIATKNPHFDERVRTLTVHVAPEIGGSFYVRPGGGVALNMWSGSMAETAFSIGPSVGVAIGRHVQVGSRMRMSPEVVARSSFERGALGWTIAAQAPMSWPAPR